MILRIACPVVFVLVAATVGIAEETRIALPAKERFHLFLLIGQSNMAGRGVVAAEDKVPHSRVLMLDKSGAWVSAIDPLHFDKRSAGVGIGRTFGIRIAENNPDITVGLIPCAVGGSPIDSWKPGVFYEPTPSHPWDDMVRRAEMALKSGVLKGVLWHQGESDTVDGLHTTYEPKLHDLIARVRRALDAPDVPFVVGQMGIFPGVPWDEGTKRVDEAHRALVEKVKGTAFVSAEGLSQKGDKWHFDSASYREFGRRYAEAYLQLTQRN